MSQLRSSARKVILSKATAKSLPGIIWWLYIIDCAHDRIYVGISPTPIRRFREHCRRASAHARMNPPKALIGAFIVGSYTEAVRAERKIKRLPSREKLKLAERSRESYAWHILVKCVLTDIDLGKALPGIDRGNIEG